MRQKNIEEILDSAKNLLNEGSANDVKKAIDLLKAIEKSEQLGLENSLILLHRRLKENESDYLEKGISTREDYKREMALIILAILLMIDEISQKIQDKIEKIDAIKKNFNNSTISDKPLVVLLYDNNEKDSIFAQELRAHLTPLESIAKEIKIEDMHYNRVSFGNQQAYWNEIIENAVLILCLISPDFFVSKLNLFEMVQNAAEEGKVIVPVLAKSTHYYANSFLGNLTSLPSNKVVIANWPDRDEAYTEIVKDIHRYIQNL